MNKSCKRCKHIDKTNYYGFYCKNFNIKISSINNATHCSKYECVNDKPLPSLKSKKSVIHKTKINKKFSVCDNCLFRVKAWCNKHNDTIYKSCANCVR